MTSLLAFFAEIDWNDVAQAALDTLTMLAWSLGWTVLLGLPLGIVLYLTGEPRLLYARAFTACCHCASTYCDPCRSSFCSS